MELLPWTFLYPIFQGLSIAEIAKTLQQGMVQYTENASLIHNCRIGREGLSFASFQLARKLDIPFVLTPVHHPRWSGRFYRYYNQLYRDADAVIALTQAEKNRLTQLGVNENRIHVTGNGPTLAENWNGGNFRQKHHLEDYPIVLFLGQKYTYKGIQALLESASIVWKRFPETRFVFIGPRTKYSCAAFKEYTDSRIIELGSVDLQEKTDALDACTLLCVPSTQESFGGVYTEAWSLGKPVIGCNIPAVAEVINDGINGFLVSQEPNSIAEKIIRLVENPLDALIMGEEGKQKVRDHFTWEKLAEKTEHIYFYLLK